MLKEYVQSLFAELFPGWLRSGLPRSRRPVRECGNADQFSGRSRHVGTCEPGPGREDA